MTDLADIADIADIADNIAHLRRRLLCEVWTDLAQRVRKGVPGSNAR
jgi:hypothetical protein